MSKLKRPLAEVLAIAEDLRAALTPHCERIELAGSLRRRCDQVGDIELCAIPRWLRTTAPDPKRDLFAPNKVVELEENALWKTLDSYGIAYSKKGDKYRQFAWRDVQVDLFTAEAANWAWIFLIRTGSATFSHHVATQLNHCGYSSSDGHIIECRNGKRIPTATEEDVFRLAEISYLRPEERSWR